MTRILFLCLVSILLLARCNHKTDDINKAVKYWKGRELKIPILTTKILGKDTVCEDLWNSEYKILRYIDTSGCTSCKLNLYEWALFIEEIEKFTPKVHCVFVVSLKNYDEFEAIQKENHFIWPVVYDSQWSLDSLNHLSHNPMLRTFLLDRNNKIIALGDPVENEKIWDLYLKIIKKEIRDTTIHR